MHTIFEPDDINGDYIESICCDLKNALISVLDNPGDDGEYDMAVDQIRLISSVLDAMMPNA